MKGVVLRTVVLLVIAVIVIGISLWFLVFVSAFEALFPNDLTTLKQYSTCALAYCSSGAGSDEVNAVGCLKYVGGRCDTSCAQVEEKIFVVGKESFTDFAGRKHYCGKDNVIPFEFSGVSLGGTIPLRSGQMDTLAGSPHWVCKSVGIGPLELDDILKHIPGVNVGFSSADILYHGGGQVGLPFPQNCIMLRKADTDVQAYTEVGIIASAFFTGGASVPATASARIVGVSVRPFIVRYIPAATGEVLGTTRAVLAERYMIWRGTESFIPNFRLTERVAEKIKSIRLTVNLPKKGKVQEWLVTGTAKGLVVTAGSNALGNIAITPERGLRLPGQEYQPATLSPTGSVSKSRGGCFTGFVYDFADDDLPSNERYLYTPIIQYDSEQDYKKVFPSAIYIDETFTSPSLFGRPECELINPAKAEIGTTGREEYINNYVTQHEADYEDATVIEEMLDEKGEVVIDDEGNPVRIGRDLTEEEAADFLRADAENSADALLNQRDPIVGMNGAPLPGLDRVVEFDYGNMISECRFRTQQGGEKITYMVYASPTFPGAGTLNQFGSFAYDVDADGIPITKDEISGFANDSSNKKSNFEVFDQFYKWVQNRVSEQVRDTQKGTTDAFSQLGSCAYVTLDRKIETPSLLSETTQEIVTKLEVKTDKDSYEKEEVVKFEGTLEVDGKPAADKEVKLEMKLLLPDLGKVSLEVQRTTTDESGKFEFETQFGGQTSANYEVVASYKGTESEPYKFTVG